MKIFVDEMPLTKDVCPYSKWVPYPPFIEEPGYWCCTFGVKDKRNIPECTLKEQKDTTCLHLIQTTAQTN